MTPVKLFTLSKRRSDVSERLAAPNDLNAYGTLEHALTTPSTPIEIVVSGEALVVINYDVWKQKILARQTGGGEQNG